MTLLGFGFGDGLGLWLSSGHLLLSGDGLGLGFCCQTLPGLPRAARPSRRFAEGKTPQRGRI